MHNTLIKYGFKTGPLKIVFDPESECDTLLIKLLFIPKFDFPSDPKPKKIAKRRKTR